MKKVVFLMLVVGLVGMVGCDRQNYVDLGLSSGTKWSNTTERSLYTFDEALSRFGDKLPSKEQWDELERECLWTWVEGESAETTGMRVTGPNGKSIFLPASGRRYGNTEVYGTEVYYVGTNGFYWSSTYVNEGGAYYMCFYEFGINVNYCIRSNGQSVRLVRD